MRCLYPITVDLSDKECFDVHWQIHRRPFIKVACGKCPACLRNKRNEWSFRILMEQRHATTSYFVTLTYRDDALVYLKSDFTDSPSLYKPHVKEFMRDFHSEAQRVWQRHLASLGQSYKERKNNRVKMKYFLVGEYGDSFDRPHYHFCVLDFPGDIEQLTQSLVKLWKYSDTIPDVRYLNGKLVNYLTKYMLKSFDDDKEDYERRHVEPPFRLMSKGIGMRFVNMRSASRMVLSGNKPIIYNKATYAYPRYFREKLTKMYYENKFSIPKNDKEFYYTLGAMNVKKSLEVEQHFNKLVANGNIQIRQPEEIEFAMRYHNSLLRNK